MSTRGKQSAKALARWAHDYVAKFGLEVSWSTGKLSRVRQQILGHVDLAVDVGANVGQWGLQVRRLGYAGRLLSIEPEPTAFNKLSRHAARDDHWEVYRAAISDQGGSAELFISDNSVSNSLLQVGATHVSAAPDSRIVDRVSVPSKRLDDVMAERQVANLETYLKVDTQGNELRVFGGAPITLAAVRAVEVELSLRQLYVGQPLLPALTDLLYAKGFVLVAMEPVFSDPLSGHLLQVDGLFAKLD